VVDASLALPLEVRLPLRLVGDGVRIAVRPALSIWTSNSCTLSARFFLSLRAFSASRLSFFFLLETTTACTGVSSSSSATFLASSFFFLGFAVGRGGVSSIDSRTFAFDFAGVLEVAEFEELDFAARLRDCRLDFREKTKSSSASNVATIPTLR
jgi:hypothetical protein